MLLNNQTKPGGLGKAKYPSLPNYSPKAGPSQKIFSFLSFFYNQFLLDNMQIRYSRLSIFHTWYSENYMKKKKMKSYLS